MKRVLSVRIENDLYTTVNNHVLSKSDLVTVALNSYLNNGSSTIVDDRYTSHLEEEVIYLRSQVNGLMLARIPLLSKIKMKLLESK